MFGTLGTSLSAYGAVGGVRLEVGGKKLSSKSHIRLELAFLRKYSFIKNEVFSAYVENVSQRVLLCGLKHLNSD